MNFKKLISTTIVVASLFSGYAQSQVHSKAHNRLLSNHVSPIERAVVPDFVEKDVENRESGSDLSPESKQIVDDLLKEAHRYIGVRYVHGAKGPNAFDCSGFSSYVYKQFGYDLSPSSRVQYTQGNEVNRNDLRKGDLVFFTSRNSRGAVGHVGIVVWTNNETGDFKFIHASIRGVKVSNCEGYYKSRYIGAKRIINK